MFLMPAGNVGLPDHDLRVDTRRQALQSLLVTVTAMTTPLQPFRGLPFIEAPGSRPQPNAAGHLQPFRGLPFIEATASAATWGICAPAALSGLPFIEANSPGGPRTGPTGLQPFRGLPFIEAGPPVPLTGP